MRRAFYARSLGVIAAFGLLSSGCYQLDPFLYTPERMDQYTFNPKGSTALTTVDPSQIEPVTLQTEDGLSLGAVYVRAAVQPPRAYVIFFHGKGSALPYHFKYLKRLSNLGYDVLGFDYRGFGISTNVTPTEAGIEKDSRAALAWLRERAGAGANRIFFYGQSFGAATATQRAEIDPPAALMLESAFGSIEEFKTDSSQMDFPAGYVALDSWATSERIKNVTAPVLLMHGLADDFVRPEFSQKIYDNAHDPKKLVLVEGAVHGNVPEVLGDQYPTLVQDFVNQYVPAP